MRLSHMNEDSSRLPKLFFYSFLYRAVSRDRVSKTTIEKIGKTIVKFGIFIKKIYFDSKVNQNSMSVTIKIKVLRKYRFLHYRFSTFFNGRF